MSFQTPLTIKATINGLNSKYFLPAIQREFVWKEEQILSLFDSLMRGYPVGSFLMWRVDGSSLNNFKFYEFIRKQKDGAHNQIADLKGKSEIEAILDGQQRLTSLYIGLKGTINKWVYKKYSPTSIAGNYEHKLYLNLLSINKDADDTENMYDFKFLANPVNNEGCFWFEVGAVLDMDIAAIMKFINANNLTDDSTEILSKLFSAVNVNPIVNYYLEISDNLHKVLNIFVRVNSGGTKLDYSDLMFSIASANWDKLDARDELNNIVDRINSIKEGFKVTKDVVLKTSLYILDKNFKFTIDNFNKANMLEIESKWDAIKCAILSSFNLIADFGFNHKTLTSNYVASVIAYDIYKNKPAMDAMRKLQYKDFITKALLKKIFGSSLDTTMETIRKTMQNGFDIGEINAKLPAGKKLHFIDEEVDAFGWTKYGDPNAFLLLSLLYPNLDLSQRWHIDHIYPKSKIKQDILENNGYSKDEAIELASWANYLCNLQLLEGLQNISKSNMEPEEWLISSFPSNDSILDYKNNNYLDPTIKLSFENFKYALENREALLLKKLKKLLIVGNI